MKKLILLISLLSMLLSSELRFEYFIQVGSTKSEEFFLKLKDVANQNSLKFTTRQRDEYSRLLIGPYDNKADAKKELDKLKKIFKNRSAYISRFKKSSSEIEKIKKEGYNSYLNRDFLSMNKSLEKAASLGDKESIYFIAKNYHYGIGISQDIKKALYWYEKCLDDTRCLNGLGNIYLDYSLDVKPDLQKAFEYIKKSSKLGSKKAKVIIANKVNIEKIHTLLQQDKVDIKLVETLFYQNSKNTKIQNLQIVNKYMQDNFTNINITLILNKKLKDAFMRIGKNQNGYWKVLEFKVY